VNSQLLMTGIIISFYRGFFDRSVHALDLSVDHWMLDFGQPVFGVIVATLTRSKDMEAAYLSQGRLVN